MENKSMQEREEAQLALMQAIFAGAKLDDDGFCGCPECGSRDLRTSGECDDVSIYCCDCSYNICIRDGRYAISEWNRIHRYSFQLEIIFPEPVPIK